jgi:hypothetical protein
MSMMSWLCRKRKCAQVRTVRPGLEVLEGRDVPSSVTLTQFTDSAGHAGLRVVTNGQNDTVTLTDDSTAGTTTVVANGVSQTFKQQFTLFDLELMSKKDTFEFDLTGATSQRLADVGVNLGKGENHFTFNPAQTGITNHSDVTLNLLGHNGNDFVNLSFGEILESRLDVQASNLGGSKTATSPSDVRDSLTFGVGKTGIRNSSVDVNIGLGQGNNNFQINYGADLGHLAGTGAAAASDFGPSTFNLNITGSSRSQDVDRVTLSATGEVNTASTLNFNVQFLRGNDSFQALFDANTFQIDDDGGVFSPGPTPGTFAPHSGGAAHFNVLAGTGSDTITFKSINQSHTIELSGLFDINILGSSGKDNVKVDFGGAGFTDDDPFELAATNRIFRLRVAGGTGDDTVKVNLANAATATFAFDVAILGGSGKNDITFIGTNPVGGTPTFGPAGAVLIDGGFGSDTQVDVFGNFPVEVLNADS